MGLATKLALDPAAREAIAKRFEEEKARANAVNAGFATFMRTLLRSEAMQERLNALRPICLSPGSRPFAPNRKT